MIRCSCASDESRKLITAFTFWLIHVLHLDEILVAVITQIQALSSREVAGRTKSKSKRSASAGRVYADPSGSSAENG